MAGSAVIGALRVNLGIDTAVFSNGLKQANSKMGKFASVMKRSFAAAAVAGTAAVGGLALAMRGTINAADEMSKAAQKIGIPTEELSKLKYAADLSGVSFSNLQTGVKRLSANMNDALSGTGEGAKAFEQLGISVAGADGKLKSSSQIMAEVADKFTAMPDGAQKTALAMDLFGKAGADMIPMLNGGSAALTKLMGEAESFGQVFTDQMGKDAEAFNDNLSRLGGAFANIAAGIAQQLLPHLVQFTDWLVANAPKIAEVAGRVIEFAASFIKAGVELTKFVVEKISQFVGAIQALPETMAQIGADIINGLWQGIQTAWNGVKDGVTGIASGIKDSFTSFFQIRSPSRVMMAVGQDIMAGLGNGMETMQSGIQGIAQSIGQTITTAFQGVIEGTKTVQDAVQDVLKSVASMMLNRAMQSFIGALFGGGMGGGAPINLMPGGFPAFANGGSFKVGGAGGIDSQLVAFKASPNETVSITKPGQAMGGRMQPAKQIVNIQPPAGYEAHTQQSSGSGGEDIIAVVFKKIERRYGMKPAATGI